MFSEEKIVPRSKTTKKNKKETMRKNKRTFTKEKKTLTVAKDACQHKSALKLNRQANLEG